MHRLELQPFLIYSAEYTQLRGEKCAGDDSLSLRASELTEHMEGIDQFGRGGYFMWPFLKVKQNFDIKFILN